MRCEQARQLFDSYLDGDLSATMATELGTHRVRCSDCRRALALLEVSGQIIASDRDEAALGEDFSSRLLACMHTPQRQWRGRIRHTLYYAGPLAAAAVITLAFVGVFDRSNGTDVRGLKVENPDAPTANPVLKSTVVSPETEEADVSVEAEQLLDQWIEKTQKNMRDKRQSGESLQEALDLTIGQWLDILEQANDTSPSEDHFPGADATGEPAEDAARPIASVDIAD